MFKVLFVMSCIVGSAFWTIPALSASISGMIYLGDGTTPITGDENIIVDIYDHENPDNPIVSTTINSTNGSYSFTGLVAGEYDLRVNASNFIDEFWASPSSVYYRYQSQVISLTGSDNLTNVNFQLDSGVVG